MAPQPSKPLATVFVPPATDPEVARSGFDRANGKVAPFPSVATMGSYRVSDFGTLKGTSIQGKALQSMSLILNQLGKELEAAQRSAKAAVDSLVAQLADSAFGQEGSKSIKKANYKELPPGIKESLAQMANSNPEMLGFSNSEDATRFLESNPVLELSYHLVITTKIASGTDSNPTISHLVLRGN